MKNKFHEKKYLSLDCLYHDKVKSKTKAVVACIGVLSIIAGVYASSLATDSAVAAVNSNTTFQVNVSESLSVSVTTPTSWGSGWYDEFLRNAIGVSVSGNNGGFTASMYSKDSTNLVNTASNSEVLPTLANSYTRANFPANYWGYSLGEYILDGATQNSYTLNGHSYGETTVGNSNSNYYPLVSTSAAPIIIMDGVTNIKKTGSQNIYFGAKADLTKAAGTYAGTIVISVVTGTIDSNTNPITPINPANDNDPNNATSNPSYAEKYGQYGGSGWTTYTTASSDNSSLPNTNTTTTQIGVGDTRSSYANPAGVIEDTYSSISEGSPLATGLAVTATVAAASGYMFFIVANRREREDEETEQ